MSICFLSKTHLFAISIFLHKAPGSETIVYRLYLFYNFNHHAGAWDHLTQSKSWPTGWTFWVDGYLEIMFLKFPGLNL